MPRTCSVCGHDQRPAIDQALVSGATYRTIADRFGLSETALKRHKREHLPAHVAKAGEALEVARADDLLTQIKGLRNRAILILQKAEAAGDYRTALAGIREARGCIETLLEVEGELARRPAVNIAMSSSWLTIQATLLESLSAYPEARQAVAGALLALEAGDDRLSA
jgi:transposase-like protein